MLQCVTFYAAPGKREEDSEALNVKANRIHGGFHSGRPQYLVAMDSPNGRHGADHTLERFGS